MRIAAFVGFVVLPAVLLAQHAPLINVNRGHPAPVGAYPYGNILHPGGTPQSMPGRRLGAIGGRQPYTGVPPGYYGNQGSRGGTRNRTVVVPYAYPVFYGGGYYQEPATNVTVVVPQQAPPNVIINNTYAPEHTRPGLQEYSSQGSQDSGVRVYDGPAPKPAAETKPAAAAAPTRSVFDEKPNIYFIALKDGTLRQAIGYWVKDNTLHYVTPSSSMNHVSMEMVDNEQSVQINAERKLEFDLKLPR